MPPAPPAQTLVVARIIWAAMFAGVGLYLAMGLLLAGGGAGELPAGLTPALLGAALVLAAGAVVTSRLGRARARDPRAALTIRVMAWAAAEGAALLGLLLALLGGGSEALLATTAVAGLALLLTFPRSL